MTHASMAWIDAFEAAHSAGTPGGAEAVPLAEALGRTLAAPLAALTALPGFDASAMDGFAVAGDGPWQLIDPVGARAGRSWSGALLDGDAVPISTGAALPIGTTRVLPIESANLDEATLHASALPSRSHLRRAGEDIAAGEIVASTGALVTPALLGLAASLGCDSLQVTRRPEVVLVVTGDELVRSGVPQPPQIRDALGPLIAPLVQRWGALLRAVVHVQDQDPLPLAEPADVIVVTGSTSVGSSDRLRREVADQHRIVDGVAVRPGHPMLLAEQAGGPWVVGLPGNPYAAFVAAHTLLLPLLTGLAGAALPDLRRIKMPLPEPSEKVGVQALPVRKDGKLWVVCPGYGSASLRGAALAEGVAITEADGSALLLRL